MWVGVRVRLGRVCVRVVDRFRVSAKVSTAQNPNPNLPTEIVEKLLCVVFRSRSVNLLL